MLAFIDESGTPHPNDTATKPTLAAVCIAEDECRIIARTMHSMKRSVMEREDMEIKGRKLLNPGTFNRGGQRMAFVESFFCRTTEYADYDFRRDSGSPDRSPRYT